MAASFDQFFNGSFTWFTGVVEDTLDPRQMGRIRVRCFGYHTSDKNEIPTDSLPWALVVTPVTSSSMSGVGTSATGIENGSWVVGFFRDGPSAQDPIVIGTIPSISTGSDPSKGFSDPTGKNPTRPGDVDTPLEARADFKESSTFVRKKDIRQTYVEKAVPPQLTSVAVSNSSSYYVRDTWDIPSPDDVVAPVYPMNAVTHSRSGHVREVDDTPGKRRISEMHASGTYHEVDDAGNKTETIVGKRYIAILSDDHIYVKGDVNLTVDGDVRTLVKGNYHLEVEGDMTEYVKGSKQTKIGQSDQKEIGQELAVNIGSNMISRVGGDRTLITDGNKNETISGNSNINLQGNAESMTLGYNKAFISGNTELSTSGHLYLTAAQDVNIETTANFAMDANGNMELVAVGDGTIEMQGALTVEATTIDLN